jgi:hypothetical protein
VPPHMGQSPVLGSEADSDAGEVAMVEASAATTSVENRNGREMCMRIGLPRAGVTAAGLYRFAAGWFGVSAKLSR